MIKLASEFGEVLKVAERLGVFDVALPFLLIFALAFAILQKIKIFGDNKSINVVVALVLGLLVVRNQFIVSLLNSFLPRISLFLVIILMFFLLVGTISNKKHHEEHNYGYVIAIIVAIGFVIYAIVASGLESKSNLFIGLGGFGKVLSNFMNNRGVEIIFGIIIIGAAVTFEVVEGEKGKSGA